MGEGQRGEATVGVHQCTVEMFHPEAGRFRPDVPERGDGGTGAGQEQGAPQPGQPVTGGDAKQAGFAGGEADERRAQPRGDEVLHAD